MGETLFDRAARDGSLTAAGELLRDYALRLLALRREASSALDELKSLERGHLQLAANEYTCMYLLPAIDAFRREFPHIGVTVQRMLASRIPEELNLRTFELGVISFRPDPAQVRTIAVYGDSLAFIVSPRHPLARAERVSIRDLGKENFIAHNVASPLRRKVIEAFQRYRTPLNMGIELPTIEAIKRFVAMGNGVALVPHLTVARELETGDLVRVRWTSWRCAACCASFTAARPRSPTPPRPFCARSEPWPRSRDRRSSTMWSGRGLKIAVTSVLNLGSLSPRILATFLFPFSRVYRLRSFRHSAFGIGCQAPTRSGHLQC